MAGYIKLHRGWHDSDLFGPSDIFCPRAAWCWLLSNAAWKPVIRTGPQGNPIPVEEGQFHTSLRALGKAWGWDKNRVDRFLKRAIRCGNIRTSAGQGGLLITICKWGEFQTKQDKRGTTTGTSAGQARDTQEEGKEGKEEKKGAYAFAGKVVRLSRNDLNNWQKSYPSLDLVALLQNRDDWLSDQPDDARKRWFQSTSSWLAKKQQAVKTAADAPAEMPLC